MIFEREKDPLVIAQSHNIINSLHSLKHLTQQSRSKAHIKLDVEASGDK